MIVSTWLRQQGQRLVRRLGYQDPLVRRAIRVQRAYWTYDKQESNCDKSQAFEVAR